VVGAIMTTSSHRFRQTEVEDIRPALCRKIARHRRKGDERRAMLLLREAACASEDDPRIWALYGAQCLRAGRVDSAVQALGHATWLRERNGEAPKARAMQRLLSKARRSRAA
jgi:Flp pilus assembly protein TadD